MILGVYDKPERYKAYVKHTDEKVQLANYLSQQYFQGKLPIKPSDKERKKALDVGCGNGVNLEILKDVFIDHQISGVEQSFAQFQYAVTNAVPRVQYIWSPFQEFKDRDFDFILTSHVLQYLDTNPVFFLCKLQHSLTKNGEAWVVQHTDEGIAQIIRHMMPYAPHLDDWKTFDDYVKVVDELGFSYDTAMLPTSIKGIDFQNPSEEGKRRLEFILALEHGFDDTSSDFKDHLAKLESKERISHPNGIIKIRGGT
jgi:SAM-dependent methyltransferase